MFESEDVIFSYTSEQAVEDGVLVHPYPKRWPWLLITASVHGAIEDAIKDTQRTYEQALVPFLQDCIMLVQGDMERDPNKMKWYDVLDGNVTGRNVRIGLNDMGGFTVMFPEDD